MASNNSEYIKLIIENKKYKEEKAADFSPIEEIFRPDPKKIEESKAAKKEEAEKDAKADANMLKRAIKSAKEREKKQKRFTRVVTVTGVTISALVSTLGLVKCSANDAKAIENKDTTSTTGYSHRISNMAENTNIQKLINLAESNIYDFLLARQINGTDISITTKNESYYAQYKQNNENKITKIELTKEQKMALDMIEVLEKYIEGENIKKEIIVGAMTTLNSLKPVLESQITHEKGDNQNIQDIEEDFER